LKNFKTINKGAKNNKAGIKNLVRIFDRKFLAGKNNPSLNTIANGQVAPSALVKSPNKNAIIAHK